MVQQWAHVTGGELNRLQVREPPVILDWFNSTYIPRADWTDEDGAHV